MGLPPHTDFASVKAYMRGYSDYRKGDEHHTRPISRYQPALSLREDCRPLEVPWTHTGVPHDLLYGVIDQLLKK